MNDITFETQEAILPVLVAEQLLPEIPVRIRKSALRDNLLLAFAVLLFVGFALTARVITNDTLATLQAAYDSMSVPQW